MFATAKKAMKCLTPKFVRRFLQTRSGRRLRHFGFAHYCPICRSHLGSFVDYGRCHILKAEECPVCGSHRRHRLIWIYFHDRFRLPEGPQFSLLHVAPEPDLTRYFREQPSVEYLSADIASPLAMVKMDLTAIPYPGDSFDAIYCSHVLEHIPDDRKAMAELHRVLKPGGWAILQVPLDATRAETVEDPSITDPDERERVFWQFDHVRLYGRDYGNRLAEAGFIVEVDWFVRSLPARVVRRLGLDPGEGIYLCRKPPACRQ
jgi:SAM-dependent methyltransferase